MKLSPEGLRLIISFEGYHSRQEDGSCKAYKCPAGVWTCGWGCTVGVTPNTHWTEAEASERLASELAKFEAAVLKHVTVPLTQNQFDALVSFAYNCGEGALKRSNLLKRVNASQPESAAKEFQKWNQGGGRVLNGLVARRAREAALYLKPMDEPDMPIMAQAVEPSVKPSRPAIATVAAVAATVVPLAPLPAIPEVVTQSVANAESWKAIGGQIWTLKSFAASEPMLAGGLAISVLALWFWPKKA